MPAGPLVPVELQSAKSLQLREFVSDPIEHLAGLFASNADAIKLRAVPGLPENFRKLVMERIEASGLVEELDRLE